MGNDGGDIPKRKQLVKDKQKVQLPNMESIAMGRSRFCNLTNQRLKQPLAIDKLGCIYNYENLLTALVKKILPSKYAYIKKLSDIRKVIVQRAPKTSLNFISCPITKLQYNGFNKFIAIWNCGHVLSRKAFKQIKNQNNNCMVCQQPFEEKDLIDLNLEGQQLEIRRKYLLQKKKKKEQHYNEDQQQLGQPKKKVKTQAFISSIDRLGGQFRDVLRQREKFRQIFHKTQELTQQWKLNTYTAKQQKKCE